VGTTDVSQVLRVPGRLCINPTDLATAWPHGGTGLGVVGSIVLEPTSTYQRITAEEFGAEVVDVLDLGETWVLGALCRAWGDNTVLSTLFPSTATGASGDKVVNYPGSYRAGTLRSSASVKLCFTPRDNRNPGLLLYKALPLVEEASRLRLGAFNELTIPVLFIGIRDSSARQISIGVLGDLSL